MFADDAKIFQVIRNREDYTACVTEGLIKDGQPNANTSTLAQFIIMVPTVLMEY